jgi:hypothetical protein
VVFLLEDRRGHLDSSVPGHTGDGRPRV